MTKAQVREKIDAAYSELARAANKVEGWTSYLQKAYDAAEAGERQHRSARRKFAHPVDTAAKYFVLKFCHEHKPGKKMTAEDAANLRSDALFAAALRCRLHKAKAYPFRKDPVEGIDYADDIVGKDWFLR